MRKLKFAILGCGFWSQFQLGAWTEIEGAECVALYNRTKQKAEELAKRFGVPRVYDDAEELLKNEKLDFIDIVTDVDTHEKFTLLGAKYGLDVICQKPMAPDYEAGKRMIKSTRDAGVRFYVHENYRWQPQFRRIKKILDSGVIGNAFRCETGFITAFPLFETQPFLTALEHFALTDQGSHQFDVLRYLFGEAKTIYCEKQRINPTIKGEDVTTSVLKMQNGVVCIQKISFSSRMEQEVFPQTLLLIEGEKGSIRLDAEFEISITTLSGTTKEVVPMRVYPWQTDRLKPEPPGIVDINQNILDDMLGKGKAENTGDDNFKTVQLVWAAYESAEHGKIINMNEF
ncbi:MAG: oxidoreductase [Bacteroidetes bacterium GWF2_42_66]|nr:MAG: oxidoreductase [Bacteroidetes bacterium GWA2_42_15]OFY00208.1 MAG: oxidoreductase [Bacteroidetes bacterium GWE2_42_39]OFY40349.1 MAG: oxidoreductase [Bacteroidetes bacterium GWF2_42_66]HBL74065.1 gfo/Idh/MocA family oxidoreductase [Prolixibacteraceae bacterium]HCR89786.1 gfo/Idh/MocA family oxidoreductase [Prolixibacteraceae bacterium]